MATLDREMSILRLGIYWKYQELHNTHLTLIVTEYIAYITIMYMIGVTSSRISKPQPPS